MTNSGSDFSTVKVGDRLWLRHIWYEGGCTVKKLCPPDMLQITYGDSSLHIFIRTGRAHITGPQVLFWAPVTIDPPPRPRSLVKKTIEVRPYIDSYSNQIFLAANNELHVDLPWCGPTQTLIIEVWED